MSFGWSPYGTNRTHDNADRLKTGSLEMDGRAYSNVYAYDRGGRQVSLTYPDGRLMERVYTARDQISQTKFAGALVVGCSYDPGMRQVTHTLANGLVKTTTFGRNDNLPTQLRIPGAVKDVLNFKYGYDPNKNKQYEQQNDGQKGHALIPFKDAFTYDSEDRLDTCVRSGSESHTQDWTPQANDEGLSNEGDWNFMRKDGVFETRVHRPDHEMKTSQTGSGPVVQVPHDAKGNLTTSKNCVFYFAHF